MRAYTGFGVAANQPDLGLRGDFTLTGRIARSGRACAGEDASGSAKKVTALAE